jgi:hypothetical protein
MKHLIIFLAMLISYSGETLAIQPVEAGLRPLPERLNKIYGEQHLLNQTLQAAASKPEDRVAAYRLYQALDIERRQLEASIDEARNLGRSPLIMFASPPGSSR